MTISYRPNSAGVSEVLHQMMRPHVHDAAEAIADQVRAERPGADVVVDDYTTDRAASSVTIRHPRGRLWAVRDGIFTRAAAARGLEVRTR